MLRVNSKWITDLNVRHKPIKILEDDMGKNLSDLGYGDACLQHQILSKELIHNLDFIKLKTSSLQKKQWHRDEKTGYRLKENICKRCF